MVVIASENSAIAEAIDLAYVIRSQPSWNVMPEFDLQMLWPTVILGGFVVGFLVGVTGVGAGSLMTPFLITKIGVSPTLAVGTDLLFASITKASAAWPHHTFGNVNWRLVGWLATGSVPGSLSMLALLKYLDPDTANLSAFITVGLVVALLVSAVAILLYPLVTHRGKQIVEPVEVPVRRLPTLLLGLGLGSAVTLTSVGAGAIGVVILTLLYPTLKTRRLIGTDIVHAVPLTLVSGLGHMSIGNTSFVLLGLLLAGSLPGIAIGSRLTGRLPDWLLRLFLSVILSFAAYVLAQKI